jgi:hypothetical protein
MSVGERSDSSRGFSQDGGFVGNSWKIPPRPAGRTITWTDYDPNMTMDEQRKRFKNLNKVLKSKLCLTKVEVNGFFFDEISALGCVCFSEIYLNFSS